MRLVRKEALTGRREWSLAKVSWEAVAFKVYVPGVQAAGDVSFEVSNEVRWESFICGQLGFELFI